MLSSRLNSQLKSSLILVIDENPSKSSLGFQFTCAYALESLNKFTKVDILLTEHNETNCFHSHSIRNPKINLIDLFDEVNSNKSLTDCIKTTDEKNLILIESLPWLFLRMNQGDLFRLLFNWSQTNVVMAVIPSDCLEDHSILKDLVSISFITVRVKIQVNTDNLEARVEQRSRTSVETIKSCLRFSIDSQLNVVNLREEKFSNRKLKSNADQSKSDVTANLTFNLRLKDDELTAKNNLVLPYTKQHIQTTNDGSTIHYTYDKEDDIDEDEDDDLDL